MFKRLVVIVDDDAFIRSLLASHLENAGFQVVVADNFTNGLRAIKSVDPDAVILDLDLGPGPGGLDIAERMTKSSEEAAIVFLTSLSDPRFSRSNITRIHPKAAYLNKHMIGEADMVVDALEAALTEKSVNKFRHDLVPDRPLGHLSKLQIQVLALIAEGKTNQQIAKIRGRSLAATSSAVTRTLKALDIDPNAEVNARVAAAHKYMSLISAPAVTEIDE